MVAHLYSGDMSILCQIHPIRFIQLWTDEVSQIRNLVILTYEGC